MTDVLTIRGFIPHGFCLSWDLNLIAAEVISHMMIMLAYFIISGILFSSAWKSVARATPRWIMLSFGTFIFLCGISHAMDALMFYLPLYYAQAAELVVTAISSITTAALMLGLVLRVGRVRVQSHLEDGKP